MQIDNVMCCKSESNISITFTFFSLFFKKNNVWCKLSIDTFPTSCNGLIINNKAFQFAGSSN